MDKERRNVRWSIAGFCALIVGGIGLYAYFTYSTQRGLDKQYTQALQLTQLPPKSAPDFTLTDQNGKTVRLSDYKGKVVVLEFMDPVCTDVCPIISQEIVNANNNLQDLAQNVVYVGVNVNQYHEDQKDLQAFSHQHGLDKLPNWHFVTGSTESLQQVWKDYGIYVKPNPTGDVEHSSYTYFIDKQGQERYLSGANTAQANTTQVGQAISYFITKLLR